MKQAFTTIELIIVLSVMAILFGTLVPNIRQYLPGIQLNGVTRTLASNLREAQEKTITEQKQYSIQFHLDESPINYRLIKIVGANQEQIKRVDLPNEISLNLQNTITNNQITFSPDGGPSTNGDITINISNISKKVNISPAGFIKIE